MNKKISTLLAAFLAAGYSYTVEAGVVKITKSDQITTTGQYIIAAAELNVSEVKVLTGVNTTLANADATLAGELPENSKWRLVGAVGAAGLKTGNTSGEGLKYGGSTGSETYSYVSSGASADLKIVEGAGGAGTFAIEALSGTNKYLNVAATPGTAVQEKNSLYFYGISEDLSATTTAKYFTIDGKYLVLESMTKAEAPKAVLVSAAQLNVLLATKDENLAKWTVQGGIITSATDPNLKIASYDQASSSFGLAATGAKVSFFGDKLCLGQEATDVTAAADDVVANAPAPAEALNDAINSKAVAFTADRPFYLGIGVNKYVSREGAVDGSNATDIFVAQNLPAKGDNVYQFVHENGTLTLANRAEFIVEEIAGTKGFYLKKVDATSDAVAYLQKNGTSWGTIDDAAQFSLVQPEAVNFSKYGDLAALEKNGFTVTLKYGNGKTDLKENPFKGHLTMMSYNSSDSKFEALDANTNNTNAFYLKSSEGFIVGEKGMFGDNTSDEVYGFKVISEADLKKDIAKGAKAAYVSTFNAKYYANQADNLSEIKLYLAVNGGDKEIGYYDIMKSNYVGAGDTPKTVTLSLGSGLSVKASDLLIKDHFYTIVKVDEKEGNSSLAVKLADDNGTTPNYTAYGEAAFLQNVNNDLEKQWALTVEGDKYVFSNRETPTVKYDGITVKSLYYADGENTYTSGEDTYIITPVAVDPADGYERLKNLRDTKYNLAYWSTVYNNAAWFTENHNDITKDQHVLGLNVDKDAALDFTAFAYDKARKVEGGVVTTASDSIYVISTLGYYNTNGIYKTTKDTLKVVSYAFVNEFNEPLAMGTDKEEQDAYVSKVDKDKYTSADKAKADAQRFVLRKDGDKLNLRPVELSKVGGEYYTFDLEKDFNKMYSGDTERGILADTKMYGRIENDLFTIEATEMPMYRTIENKLDTISIYRQENNEDVMYEKGLFLGIANNVQFPTIAPAMVADLAHVDAEGHRPQYLLMVQPNVVEGGTWCPVHGFNPGCSHAQKVEGYTEGRYLVNLKDTAIVWGTDNHQKGNPYVNSENFYKLGFVSASHLVDTLIIKSDSNKIELNKEDYNVAKFAFRYVDNEAKSFVIETADYNELGKAKEGEMKETYGYLKWMNDVVVVVNNIRDADVFNMDENYAGDPTANEDVTVSSISVAATNGAVIIKGAEGKKVSIVNVLGQTIANTVITSSEATIAAPAGVVVVSVEGEAAVKAIVK